MQTFYNNSNYTELQNLRDRIDQQLRNLQQPITPINNIINTNNTVDFEAKFLNENETVEDTLVKNKTLFIDEKNSIISIKEIDGSISKKYQIIVPKDEKEILKERLDLLEKQNYELKEKIDEYTKCNISNDEIKQSNANDNDTIKSTAKRSSK